MPRNLSGVYTLPAGNPVVPGTTIDANWANSTLSDMANEITNSLSRTGAGGMLAPFRIDDGNVTGPGLAFLTETNTGYYRIGAGSTAFSVLGVSTLQLNTTSVTVPSTRTLNAQGNALVGGTFGVTGVAAFGSTLAVTGAITALGGVIGNVTAASGTSSFNDVTISGSLDMVAGSSATITGLSNPTNASDAANKGYVDTQDALRLALTGGTMSGVIAMGTNKITGLGTPTADTDAATKAYVDSVAQGLDVKGSVRAATTGNITLSGAQTIDGVAVIAGDRVLVKDQSTAANNGIYVAAAGAWSRAADADTWAELVGAFVFVEDGTVNDNSGWVCTSPPGGTLGVTAVTFEQFSGAGQINAGTGMTKNGNTLNVNTASSSRIVVGADEIDLATTGVTAGTYKSVTVDLYGRVTAGTNPTTLAGYGISDAYTTTQTDALLAQRLALTGGTMTGAIAMSTNRITGMGDPVNAQDAATKNYIDTIFGSTASAAASAAAAASSASAASTSASNAATSASNASSSASAAATSASNAATSLFNFRAQYLGPLASDPTVDGNGNAVTTGDLYFNTVANETRVYNGSAWVAAYVPSAIYLPLAGGTMTGSITYNPGTANGVAYLNGSKVLTTGSALTFNGTNTFTVIPATGTAYNRTESTQFSTWLQTGAGNANVFWEFSAGTPVRWVDTSAGEQMRLTSTGLGIGTTTFASGSKLAVQTTGGKFDVRAAGVASVVLNSSGGMLYNAPTGNFHRFQINDVTLMELDSSGNLGLGVTPSAWYSTYRAFEGANGALYFRTDTVNDTGFICNAYRDSGATYRFKQNGAASYYQQGSGAHYWFTSGSSGTAGNAISWTQALTLDASGNLLLGTTTASEKFSLVQSGANGAGIQLNQTGTGGRDYRISSTGTGYGSAGNLIFYDATASAERARITSGGYFKASNNGSYVGSTGSYHELVVDGTGANWTVIVSNSNATAANCFGQRIAYTSAAPNGTGNRFLACEDTGGERASIRSNGGLANYSGNDVNLSDRREKTNFAPAKSYLDTICAIPVQTFNYIDQSEDDPGLTLGVVAQDVQAVAPELVMESNWGTAEDPKMRLSIYQTDLQYALMKCIQELKAELDTVKAELAILKGQP